MVNVFYRLPHQGELVDEDFLLQLQEASHSQALTLMKIFNYPFSAGKEIQWVVSNSGDFWSALRITSWSSH